MAVIVVIVVFVMLRAIVLVTLENEGIAAT